MGFSWSFLAMLIVLAHPFHAIALGENETDHLALLHFKSKITADTLGVLSSWNATIHFCNWHGVTCSHGHQRVTTLDLSHSKLAGSISPHIGNLSFLREVYLQNNSFTHQIPPEFGRLRRLEQLVLHTNSIQGTIPANISSCSNLIKFRAARNKLVGEIPAELCSMSKLRSLILGTNNLTGSIPLALGNLSSLEELSMPENNLVGSIPNSLGQLRNLTTIFFAVNKLTGTIPPSIFNLTSIKAFDFSANQIHGTLPANLGGFYLPNIEFFSIAANQFTGSIPISISNASHSTLFQASRNNLTGKVPSLEKLHLLQVFRIGHNRLGSGGAEDLSFICTFTNATSLVTLDLNVNNFGGALPECISNLSSTLAQLLLDNNKMTGTIPAGIGNLVNLEKLDLWNNQLSGHVPHEIGNLQKLQHLILGANNLSGNIPSSIGNLKLLLVLYLYSNSFQGSIPSSLGQCQNLNVLSLFNNNLSGPIPREVIGISSLSIDLSLHRNQLSGVLPMEIANLKNLGHLDISNNLLSGEIPNGLGSCVKLETLRLGGNFFQGEVPSSLSSLRGTIELDLSRNNLSGKIPHFLEGFESLQILNLSYNNFEGSVPMKGVFKNASAASITGNNELCGGIPEFQLPKCNSKESYKKSRFTLAIVLISWLVAVFLISFLLFCCFKKKRTEPTASSSWNFVTKLSYQDLLRATDKFSSANVIGVGSFGHVYKGVLDQEETVVAVKVLHLSRHGALKSFMAECEALRNIKHRNLLKVLTACSGVDYKGNDFKALVYEFMVNGSLEEWLHTDKAPRKLSFVQRLNIVIDVANALDYLHNHHHQSPIVHCDIKPSNILLDGEMMGHVGDFGLARFLQDASYSKETSSIAIKGTIGYTAPEYGMGNELKPYGDVYSYGIMLLEVFTGKRPTNEMFEDGFNLCNFVKDALPERVAEVADPTIFVEDGTEEKSSMMSYVENQSGTRKGMVLNCLISIFEIGVACSAELARERLSISDVVTQLACIKNKLTSCHSQFCL